MTAKDRIARVKSRLRAAMSGSIAHQDVDLIAFPPNTVASLFNRAKFLRFMAAGYRRLYDKLRVKRMELLLRRYDRALVNLTCWQNERRMGGLVFWRNSWRRAILEMVK